METNFLMVLCTYPLDAKRNKSVDTLIDKIVANKIGACVKRIPEVASTFIWARKINKDTEELLIINTSKEKYHDLCKLILAEHPYDCPEIIALPIVAGHKGYLEWMQEQTSQIE